MLFKLLALKHKGTKVHTQRYQLYIVLPRSAPKQLTNKENPFTDSARAYLKDACSDLSNSIDELRGSAARFTLSSHLVTKLHNEYGAQELKLKKKLLGLCSNSMWNNIGRTNLITNLSDIHLSKTETQVLSLGLKFDTGLYGKQYGESINKNYRWDEKDVEKGFKQGVISCYHALANNNECSLPRRFMKALEDLSRRTDILITQADKGGGIVVMNKSSYVEKMHELLNDENTYKKMPTGFAQQEADEFKKKARKILSRTKKGKEKLGLLEEAPRPPRMRGIPKIHKAGIPMRPITSGIGSAPHRLAKQLAKPLSALLRTISDAHLRNSSDLIRRLEKVNFERKKLASYDVTALFTNVSIEGAIEALKRVINSMNESDFPVRKTDYIELVSLCVNFGAFVFEGQEFEQHRGLAMGSPLKLLVLVMLLGSFVANSQTGSSHSLPKASFFCQSLAGEEPGPSFYPKNIWDSSRLIIPASLNKLIQQLETCERQ
ncbi:uncharacterized protein LOC143022012 [Oratosquilla oratoria]|uniref:uncharacterized protein LOC143022012 n=1 Tax=Oratosquilla oratoria TaxID=337810 RepID=UPI003F76FC79